VATGYMHEMPWNRSLSPFSEAKASFHRIIQPKRVFARVRAFLGQHAPKDASGQPHFVAWAHRENRHGRSLVGEGLAGRLGGTPQASSRLMSWPSRSVPIVAYSVRRNIPLLKN
jgi:hypothetical protein